MVILKDERMKNMLFSKMLNPGIVVASLDSVVKKINKRIVKKKFDKAKAFKYMYKQTEEFYSTVNKKSKKILVTDYEKQIANIYAKHLGFDKVIQRPKKQITLLKKTINPAKKSLFIGGCEKDDLFLEYVLEKNRPSTNMVSFRICRLIEEHNQDFEVLDTSYKNIVKELKNYKSHQNT